MQKVLYSVLLLFVLCVAATADDWKVKQVSYPPDVAFRAADRAVLKHYKIEVSDSTRRVIRFKVGTTAWAYGYTITLSIDSVATGSSKITAFIEKKGSGVVSWGNGKSEVQRVYVGIDEELVLMNQAAAQPNNTGK